MKFRNDQDHFGLLAIMLHWVIAVMTLSLFFLGLWMVDLDYYDVWYQRAPWWHKGLGVLLMTFVIFRWVWQYFNSRPRPLASIPKWQQQVSHIVHLWMNLLILAIGLSGYLIVTAKGQALSVFDVIQLPAIVSGMANLEDIAGEIHDLLAYLLMSLVVVHILAALKHHLINKDITLLRMLGR